jgi:hypothetical protein
LQTVANNIVDTIPARDAFIAAFDTLSPSIKLKAFQVLRAHPHLGLADLLDVIEPKMTLSETAEAEKFVRYW